VNSKSREISTIKSYSSEDEDRSITGAVPEGPPCSSTGERGRREDTSIGNPEGGGVLDCASGGVLASLVVGLPSMEGEHSRLMPLLPSIVGKQRMREGNPKRGRDEEKECEMVPSGERRRYL
jgi:hypothetical protein